MLHINTKTNRNHNLNPNCVIINKQYDMVHFSGSPLSLIHHSSSFERLCRVWAPVLRTNIGTIDTWLENDVFKIYAIFYWRDTNTGTGN